jgi:PIN domain nuclease of toxin-antitoxin system
LNPRRFLFDTHAFLWWMDRDESKLPENAFDAIQDTASEVFVSVINAWEMAIKTSMGKLESPHDVTAAVEHYGFGVLPVLLPHAAAVRDLPLHHRDPFDRMLIAQARVEGLTLITTDPNMRRYDVPILPA